MPLSRRSFLHTAVPLGVAATQMGLPHLDRAGGSEIANAAVSDLERRLGRVPPQTYVDRLRYEITALRGTGVLATFLAARDVARCVRKQGQLLSPCGTVGCSLLGFAWGLSPIDPIAHGLHFERFFSPGRQATICLCLPTVTDIDALDQLSDCWADRGVVVRRAPTFWDIDFDGDDLPDVVLRPLAVLDELGAAAERSCPWPRIDERSKLWTDHARHLTPLTLALQDRILYPRDPKLGADDEVDWGKSALLPQPRCWLDMAVVLTLVNRSPDRPQRYWAELRTMGRVQQPPHPSLTSVVAATDGLLIFQEQIMDAIVRVSGLSYAAADEVRRVFGRRSPRLSALWSRRIAALARQRLGVTHPESKEIVEWINVWNPYTDNKHHWLNQAVLHTWIAKHFTPRGYRSIRRRVALPHDTWPDVDQPVDARWRD